MSLKEKKFYKYEQFQLHNTFWLSSVNSMRQKIFWFCLLWVHSIFCFILMFISYKYAGEPKFWSKSLKYMANSDFDRKV